MERRGRPEQNPDSCADHAGSDKEGGRKLAQRNQWDKGAKLGAMGGARPAPDREAQYDKPGDAVASPAAFKSEPEEKSGQEGRRNDEPESGQDFQPRRGAHPQRYRPRQRHVQERPLPQRKPSKLNFYRTRDASRRVAMSHATSIIRPSGRPRPPPGAFGPVKPLCDARLAELNPSPQPSPASGRGGESLLPLEGEEGGGRPFALNAGTSAPLTACRDRCCRSSPVRRASALPGRAPWSAS